MYNFLSLEGRRVKMRPRDQVQKYLNVLLFFPHNRMPLGTKRY